MKRRFWENKIVKKGIVWAMSFMMAFSSLGGSIVAYAEDGVEPTEVQIEEQSEEKVTAEETVSDVADATEKMEDVVETLKGFGDVAYTEKVAASEEDKAAEDLNSAIDVIEDADSKIDGTHMEQRPKQATDKEGNLLFNEEDGTPIYVQATDEEGNLLTDEKGNPIYEQEYVQVPNESSSDQGLLNKDAEEKIPVYKQQVDENGEPVFDENGNPVYVQDTDVNGDPKVDENGNPVYVQATDENGDLVFETVIKGQVEENAEEAGATMNDAEEQMGIVSDQKDIVDDALEAAETAEENNDLTGAQDALQDALEAQGKAQTAYDQAAADLVVAEKALEEAQAAYDAAKEIGGDAEAKAQEELNKAIAHAEEATRLAKVAKDRVDKVAGVVVKIDTIVNNAEDRLKEELLGSLDEQGKEVRELLDSIEKLESDFTSDEMKTAMSGLADSLVALAENLAEAKAMGDFLNYAEALANFAELNAKYIEARVQYEAAIKLLEKTELVDENGEVKSDAQEILDKMKSDLDSLEGSLKELEASNKDLGAAYESELASAKLQLAVAKTEEEKEAAAKILANLIIGKEVNTEVENKTVVYMDPDSEDYGKYGSYEDADGNKLGYWVVLDNTDSENPVVVDRYTYGFVETGDNAGKLDIITLQATGSNTVSMNGKDYLVREKADGTLVLVEKDNETSEETPVNVVEGEDGSKEYYVSTEVGTYTKESDIVGFTASRQFLEFLGDKNFKIRLMNGKWQVKYGFWYDVRNDNGVYKVDIPLLGTYELNASYKTSYITIDNQEYDIKDVKDGHLTDANGKVICDVSNGKYFARDYIEIVECPENEKTVSMSSDAAHYQDLQRQFAEAADKYLKDKAEYDYANAVYKSYVDAIQKKQDTSFGELDKLISLDNIENTLKLIKAIESGDTIQIAGALMDSGMGIIDAGKLTVSIIKEATNKDSYLNKYVAALKEVVRTQEVLQNDLKEQAGLVKNVADAIVNVAKAGKDIPADAVAVSINSIKTTLATGKVCVEGSAYVLVRAAQLLQNALTAKVQSLQAQTDAAYEAAVKAETDLKNLKLTTKAGDLSDLEAELEALWNRYYDLKDNLDVSDGQLKDIEKEIAAIEEIIDNLTPEETTQTTTTGGTGRGRRAAQGDVLGAKREDLAVVSEEGDVLGATRAPKTSDASKAILWMLVMGCSAIGAAAVMAQRKKEEM
ncbi:MAG: hypothetical protein ACI4FV_02890 [Lachnospiraceae bacterium]